MRQTLFGIAVENDLADTRGNLLFKSIAQALRVFVAFGHFALGQFGRGAKCDDVGDGFSAAAPLSLLMTTDLLGSQPHAFANKQSATSFRRIDLVRRKRK